MRRARRRQRHVHRRPDRRSLARQGSDRSLPRRDVLYVRGIPAPGRQARDHGCRTLDNKTTNVDKQTNGRKQMLKRIVASMALAITAVVAVTSLTYADALDDIKKVGKIRIAIDLGVPPYGMTDDKM